MGIRRSLWGLHQTTPGKLANYGYFLSLWSYPILREGVPHSWCGVPHLGGMLFLHSHMSESPNPVSPNCQLPTPMGSKCNPVKRRDGASWDPTRLCPKKGSCVPGVGIPAAPELWGQARRCRSVLGGWCSRPTRCSRFGLGLHVLYTGQDFLLVSCQSDSNSEQVLSGDLADQLEGAKPSSCKTFFISSHLDGSKPLTHRAKS